MATEDDHRLDSQAPWTRGRGWAPHIPVLTVRQPFASLLVHGIKDVENRSWTPRHRGAMFIHAGRAPAEVAPPLSAPWLAYPTGSVIGLVELVEITTDASSRWADHGQHHWHVRPLLVLDEPVPVRGKLHLWRLPDDVAAVVEGAVELRR